MDLEIIKTKLLKAFGKEDVKKAVLDDDWYELNKQNAIDSTGFCFAASEVIYRLNGGKDNWKILSIKDPKDWNNGTHYFLINKHTNEILDITKNQYEDREIDIPYHKGKSRGLRNTSNKAKKTC